MRFRILIFIEKSISVFDQPLQEAEAGPAKPDYCGQIPISSAISRRFT